MKQDVEKIHITTQHTQDEQVESNVKFINRSFEPRGNKESVVF